ncbi:MAG: hypothetical protein ACC652_10630, partial [Acidimicrobiales bacterium]
WVTMATNPTRTGSRRPLTLSDRAEAHSWLAKHAGDDLETRTAGAELEQTGAGGSLNLMRARSRFGELAFTLAGFRRFGQPRQLSPEQRRAIWFALCVRACEGLDVNGWADRLVRATSGDDAQYRSTAFEFEWATNLALSQRDTHQQLAVSFIADSEEGRTADLAVGDLVVVECKRLIHSTEATSALRARALRTTNKARSQLPRDKPSIICLDLYEPLLALGASARDCEQRDVDNGLVALLGKHGRPSGLLYNMPHRDTDDPAARETIYNGNRSPTVPFPPEFELFPRFFPSRSETLRE